MWPNSLHNQHGLVSGGFELVDNELLILLPRAAAAMSLGSAAQIASDGAIVLHTKSRRWSSNSQHNAGEPDSVPADDGVTE